jgi:hypothetical protein
MSPRHNYGTVNVGASRTVWAPYRDCESEQCFKRAVVALDSYARRQARQQTLPTPDSRCSTAHGLASHDVRPSHGCDEREHLCQATYTAHPASRQRRGVWYWATMVGFGPTTRPPLQFGSGPAERP